MVLTGTVYYPTNGLGSSLLKGEKKKRKEKEKKKKPLEESKSLSYCPYH